MFRLVLLLLVVGGLAIFVLQNVSPVLPLVFLGMQTQALPVGLWVLGAIAAGAATTVLLSVLLRVASPRSKRRPGARRSATQFAKGPSNPSSGSSWTPPAWRSPNSSSRNTNRAAAVDDWEQPRQPEEWEDWSGYEEPAKTTPKAAPRAYRQTENRRVEDNPFQMPLNEPVYEEPIYDGTVYDGTVYDTKVYDAPVYDAPVYDAEVYDAPVYGAQDRSQSYEEPLYAEPEDAAKDEWDDWEEPVAPNPTKSSEPPEPPPRDFVEVRRDPQTRYRSGTIYSYSYRQSEDVKAPADAPSDSQQTPPPDTTAETASKPAVEVDYRVINPPHKTASQPEEATLETADEEWEDWETEPLAPPPEKPYQNPPLNLGGDRPRPASNPSPDER